jgi:hypothetical protein
MDCDQVRRLLEFTRPGVAELDGPDLVALESHLASCAECNAHSRSERRRDERLAQMLAAVATPIDGPARVLARLALARRVWWRNRVLAAAAIVIGLTLATTLTYQVFGRPNLDPFAVAQAAYEQAGQWRSAEEARNVADGWLKKVDGRLSAPAEWNYTTLAFLGRSDFEGVSAVPTLVFVRGDATARVFVVRASAFKNLAAFDQPVEEGGCTVAVRRYADQPDWAFIVVTTGGPVERFLRAPPSQQSA